ncbi:MAG: alkaline phosphatase family protein [Abditibacteriales bacterium]|nr:alkaline phosphatase family protein [Abditibacteriales bacterium]MDW8367075.1 alkaline phosphatase family protein [Abditibacteriales bacterium]
MRSHGFPPFYKAFYAVTFIVIAAILLRPARSPSRTHTSAPLNGKPKLVLLLVIDGFRADRLTKFDDLFGEGGFKRLMERGAWFTNAHYGHATTYTAAGHAVIATGAYANRNGMVSNDWHDREKKSRVYCCEDDAAQVLGELTKRHGGTSPKNLLSTTVGDELRMSNNLQSKSIAISLKDRGAILLGGKLGTAYWWSSATGRFVTTTKYAQDYPAWVKQFNDARYADRYFGKEWTRLLPESAYTQSVRDDRPYEIDMLGNGRTFPHKITGRLDKPGSDFYEALEWTPFADELTLEFAKAAVTNEQLGKRNITDFLSISLSAHDMICHLFGPESQEAADIVLRLDRMLADFFQFLDQQIGMDHVIVALTADHGFMPTPEWSVELGLDAGRIDPEKMTQALNDALSAKFGSDRWVEAFWNPALYLNHTAMKAHGVPARDVEEAAADFLRSYPGIAECLTRTQILSGRVPDTALSRRVVKAFHRERSGDVIVVPKPLWYLHKKPTEYAATHGSPYAYDTHVPVILMGEPFRSGVYATLIDVVDVAPTLANVLGIAAPTLCEGRVLHEAIQQAENKDGGGRKR